MRKGAKRGQRQKELPASSASLRGQRGPVEWPCAGHINQPERVCPELQSKEQVRREAGAKLGRALNSRQRTQIYLENSKEPCEVSNRRVPSKRRYFHQSPAGQQGARILVRDSDGAVGG